MGEEAFKGRGRLSVRSGSCGWERLLGQSSYHHFLPAPSINRVAGRRIGRESHSSNFPLCEDQRGGGSPQPHTNPEVLLGRHGLPASPRSFLGTRRADGLVHPHYDSPAMGVAELLRAEFYI